MKIVIKYCPTCDTGHYNDGKSVGKTCFGKIFPDKASKETTFCRDTKHEAIFELNEISEVV